MELIHEVDYFRQSGGETPEILAKRKKTLEEAKRKHPDRWRNRPRRNCSIEETVYLNPEKEPQEKRRD
ncbi:MULTISPECIES: hypothetical protein [Dethiosulfovibrio]|uniref:Uncharacterized protein n=2 Tax=Dethiosulfovibrio TaxID=47054 RepID=A0ABS9EP82_9BACT|nr:MULTISPECIES: hypothetical protein [Dethiosulfovibrio]MCF4113369.1 hypothetical protein [Dethiosulfovibrio russensis]MCF4142494.1 hypothetical protein [Dethiosulfovibrio marinus]MCF4145890.1 hypothetical protein [Dethiosulfovibrio acidaminovorans]MEA3283948.1 hypothetical protein [Synergistota bacterium]